MKGGKMPKRPSDFAIEVMKAYNRKYNIDEVTDEIEFKDWLSDKRKDSTREQYNYTIPEICDELGLNHNDTCKKIIERGMVKCLRRLMILNRVESLKRSVGHLVTDEGIDEIVAGELSDAIKNKDFSSTASLFI
jgi:hypothetical protein